MDPTPFRGLSRKAADDVQMSMEDFLPCNRACIPANRPSRRVELV